MRWKRRASWLVALVAVGGGFVPVGLFESSPRSVAAQREQPKSAEELAQEELAWIAEQLQKFPLSEEQSAQFEKHIADLSADSYGVREAATLAILLMPTGTVERLKALKSAPNLEVEARATWLFDGLRSAAPLASLYLSRAAGIGQSLARRALDNGGPELTELLSRLTPARIGTDQRIWNALILAADDVERTTSVLSLYRDSGQQQPALTLYKELISSGSLARPSNRARLLECVATNPAEEALGLAEASATDPSGILQDARRQLLRRLQTELGASRVLALWEAAAPDESARRRMLIDLLTLKGADAEVKRRWIEIASEEQDPSLGEAFLELACREGESAILDARVARSGRTPRFYALLSLVGNSDSWDAVLKGELTAADRIEAISWIPYTLLTTDEQARRLLSLLGTAGPALDSALLACLSGYGSNEVTKALLDRLQARAGDLEIGETLSWHGHILAGHSTPDGQPLVAAPWDAPWFSALSPIAKVRVLSWYRGQDVDARLAAFLRGRNADAAAAAADALADRRVSLAGAQFASFKWEGELSAIDVTWAHWDRTPEAVLQPLLGRADELGKTGADIVDLGSHHVRADSRDLRALAIFGYEPLRAACRAGRFERSVCRALLALYPDAAENGDLDAAVANSPEIILAGADVFLELGHSRAVVKALLQSVEFGSLQSRSDWGPIQHAMVRSLPEYGPSQLLLGLHRHADDSPRLAALAALASNGSDEDYLDTLEAVGMRSTAPALRAAILLAATGSKGLTPAWLPRVRERWSLTAPIPDAIRDAMEIVEAYASGSVRDLELRLTGEFGHLCSAMAARLGSRIALQRLFDAETGQFDPDLAPASDSLVSQRLARPENLLADFPTDMTRSQWRAYWRGTRFAWQWDAKIGKFSMGGSAE